MFVSHASTKMTFYQVSGSSDDSMGTLKNTVKQSIGHLFKNLFVLSNKKMQIILMYHRVVDELPEKMHDPHMFVRSDTFDMHIKEIAKYFQIVNLDEMLNQGKGNRRLCALTFDDGWLDNYKTAFPILRNYKISATIFLPVTDIGTIHRFWFEHLFYLANALSTIEDQNAYIAHFRTVTSGWNPGKLCTTSILELTEALKNQEAPVLYEIIDSAYKKLKIEPSSEKILMDWEQVREMGQNRITFGSHGLQHDILPALGSRLKRDIVFESLSILRDKTVSSIPVFSYPNGNWDLETVDFLKRAGYHGAVTTKNGFYSCADPFLLNRIGVTETSSNTSNLLWFQIAKAFCKV